MRYISTGDSFSFAITKNDNIYSWGENGHNKTILNDQVYKAKLELVNLQTCNDDEIIKKRVLLANIINDDVFKL